MSNAYRQVAIVVLRGAILMPYIENKRFKVFYECYQTKLLSSLFRDYDTQIIEDKYSQKCWMLIDVKKEQAVAFGDRLRRNEFLLNNGIK